MTSDYLSPNDETRAAWNANTEIWDTKMGNEGNDFFRILQWPAITEFLNIEPGQHIIFSLFCGYDFSHH